MIHISPFCIKLKDAFKKNTYCVRISKVAKYIFLIKQMIREV